MLRGGGNGARKGHGQGVGGKRREREEARARRRTEHGTAPFPEGRTSEGRTIIYNNIMSRSGRARGKREEGTAEKTRAVGGEDRRSGRRGRQEERTAGKAGRNGKKTTENDKKRQDAARQPVGLATSGLQRITTEKPAFPPRRITDCNRKNENISPKIPLFQKNTYLC